MERLMERPGWCSQLLGHCRITRVTRPATKTCLLAGLALFLFVYIAFVCFVYLKADASRTVAMSSSDWASVDLEKRPLHTLSEEEAINLKARVESKTKTILGIPMSYKECLPQPAGSDMPQTLLLLHGASFTSNTWIDVIPTMQTMCKLGRRVVAVDLPGHGNTPACKSAGCKDKSAFLAEVLRKVTGEVSPIIVSPSFSGSYSLPFLEKHQDLAEGFVTVAPVGTDKYQSFLRDSMSVPTMIVYGELDTGLGLSSAKYLTMIRTATKPQVLPKAGHACYLIQPEKWHQLLYNFMEELRK